MKIKKYCQPYRCTGVPAIPTLGSPRQEDHKIRGSLNCLVRPCMRKQKGKLTWLAAHTWDPSTRKTNKEALLLFSAGYRRRLVSKAKERGHKRAQAGEHLPSKYGNPRTHAKIPGIAAYACDLRACGIWN